MRKAILGLLLLYTSAAAAAETSVEQEPIVVTATRINEDVAKIPGSVTVIGGEELRDRGAVDLHGALSLAAGIDVAPGGDAGPGTFVPEFWGFKEADAYLLVVDGVPWGGAFNPAASSLDLHDVERIEVLRGAAPVMYGATSFVGVIHVIHKEPGKVQRQVRAYVGSWHSKGGGVSAPLAPLGKLKSAVSADVEQRGFRDARTKLEKYGAGWRAELETSLGKLKIDTDADIQRNRPASPHLRTGAFLESRVPLDSNQNLSDAFLNEDRYTVSLGLDHPITNGNWSTALSYSHNVESTLRGFLKDITVNPNAHGFRENIYFTNIYFDSHGSWTPVESWKLVAGVDHLHGRGFGHGGDFDYQVNLDGSGAPAAGERPLQADIKVTDQRDFSGLYGFAEWEPIPPLVVEGGVRLNHTEETRATRNLDLTDPRNLTVNGGEKHVWRASGSAGVTFKAWRHEKDLLNLYTAYRNAFKPAAVDLGLDTQAGILEPERSESFEAGVKSRWLDDRLDFNASWFLMDFTNQVINASVNGNAALVNGGATRTKGVEFETAWHAAKDLTWRGAYSWHDARFVDSIQDFGGVATQLAGKRFETSADNMASTGLTYAPKQGLRGDVGLNYVGGRYLDKRNRAYVKDYAAWGASLGWRQGAWEVLFKGRNLNDQRVPVSESELGDGQYYLLAARTLELSVSWDF